MSHVIPKMPDTLYFEVDRMWNGDPCGDESLHAEIWIMKKETGLEVRVHAPQLPNQRVPNAPHDTRVDGLWEYDAVELFFVGDDGKYTEVELGPGGNYLILSFDGVRQRSNDWEGREFDHRSSTSTPGTWQSVIQLPWDVLPGRITKMNTFLSMDGKLLAWNAVPGSEPDFHQPDTFPEVTLAE